MKILKTAKTGYIVSSAVLCAVGLVIIINPGISLKAVCYAAGVMFIICGAFKLIGYFSNDLYSLAFQHDLSFGVLSQVLGLIVLFNPEKIISILHFLIGLIILLDGLIKIQTAVESKRFGLSKWPAIAVMAAVSCILGLLLVIKPFSGAKAIMTFLGLCVMAEGVLNLFVGIYTIKIFDEKSAIDAEYREKF